VLVGLLVLLSLWSVGYELGDTLLPGLRQALPFEGIAPDVAFALAGLVLIARGFNPDPPGR
jgi:hypothetical protein